jgi:ATP-dependent Zn protease
MVIDVATIERRGTIGGFVSSIPPEDRFTHWRSEYETDIQVALASLAGERMLFDGDNSSGVGGDLRSATQLATMMSGYWGMGSTFASHQVQRQFGIGGGRGGGGGEGDGDDREHHLLESTLGEQVEARLGEMFERVSEVLRENRIQVLAVAHALETHLTITGEDVEAIIEGTEGPFIDGAGYFEPTTIARLEEYHQAVLDFRASGIEELPALPEIEGVTGRLVESVVASATPADSAGVPVSES